MYFSTVQLLLVVCLDSDWDSALSVASSFFISCVGASSLPSGSNPRSVLKTLRLVQATLLDRFYFSNCTYTARQSLRFASFLYSNTRLHFNKSVRTGMN